VLGDLLGSEQVTPSPTAGDLEDEAVRVRRGRGGGRVEAAEGLVAAAYRHRMSRALDPQLHTHVVAANVACGPDGRWTALHGHKLYTHAKNAGFLYQAHLRAEVRERLGLEWGPVVKGAAELVDVAPDVLALPQPEPSQVIQRGDLGLDDAGKVATDTARLSDDRLIAASRSAPERRSSPSAAIVSARTSSSVYTGASGATSGNPSARHRRSATGCSTRASRHSCGHVYRLSPSRVIASAASASPAGACASNNTSDP